MAHSFSAGGIHMNIDKFKTEVQTNPLQNDRKVIVLTGAEQNPECQNQLG